MNINYYIAKTYIVSNKKLTLVAVMGVLLGMSIYIFMNSMVDGFDKNITEKIFKSSPHIRVFKDDAVSKPLVKNGTDTYVIINPKVVPMNNTLTNPKMVKDIILKLKDVEVVSPLINTTVFYNKGISQMPGNAVGILPDEAEMIYNIKYYMVDGEYDLLKSKPNGILIGSGISEKMSLKVGDNLNLTSQKGVNKNFEVIGIFKVNNLAIDETKSYINLASSQQLLQESPSYITELNVKVHDPEKAEKVATQISQQTGYHAMGWKEANETIMSGNRVRAIVITLVSFTILLVAGFGIFNILNMTVTQKINDIAILKAMGFKGKDVIIIFVTQAIAIGIMGVIGGVIAAIILVTFLKKIYIGADVGYFPIDYVPLKFLQGVVVGMVITFLAGYIPARKAAKVDPVTIFRK